MIGHNKPPIYLSVYYGLLRLIVFYNFTHTHIKQRKVLLKVLFIGNILFIEIMYTFANGKISIRIQLSLTLKLTAVVLGQIPDVGMDSIAYDLVQLL